MAKSTKKKLTKLEMVQKSLNAAAKILNKKLHQPVTPPLKVKALNGKKNALALEAARVVLFQVFCESEEKVISAPSTNEAAQQKFSTLHDKKSGHTSKVLSTT